MPCNWLDIPYRHTNTIGNNKRPNVCTTLLFLHAQPCARNPTFATENVLFSPPPVTFETHKEAPASCFYFISSLAIFHCSIVVPSCLVCSASFFFFFPSKSIFWQSVQRELCFFSYFFFINIIIIYCYGYYYFILHKKLITSIFYYYYLFYISISAISRWFDFRCWFCLPPKKQEDLILSLCVCVFCVFALLHN